MAIETTVYAVIMGQLIEIAREYLPRRSIICTAELQKISTFFLLIFVCVMYIEVSV